MKTPIHHTDLPKAALRKISKRQRTYIDEFRFFVVGECILAEYGGDYIGTWSGRKWEHEQV